MPARLQRIKTRNYFHVVNININKINLTKTEKCLIFRFQIHSQAFVQRSEKISTFTAANNDCAAQKLIKFNAE